VDIEVMDDEMRELVEKHWRWLVTKLEQDRHPRALHRLSRHGPKG